MRLTIDTAADTAGVFVLRKDRGLKLNSFDDAALHKLRIGVQMIGIQGRTGGEQFDDDQNRFSLGRFFTIDAIPSRRLSSRFDIFVAAENLLNQTYLTGRTPVTTVGPPLLIRGGIRFRLRG